MQHACSRAVGPTSSPFIRSRITISKRRYRSLITSVRGDVYHYQRCRYQLPILRSPLLEVVLILEELQHHLVQLAVILGWTALDQIALGTTATDRARGPGVRLHRIYGECSVSGDSLASFSTLRPGRKASPLTFHSTPHSALPLDQRRAGDILSQPNQRAEKVERARQRAVSARSNLGQVLEWPCQGEKEWVLVGNG